MLITKRLKSINENKTINVNDGYIMFENYNRKLLNVKKKART